MTLYQTQLESPLGTLTLVASDAGLRRVYFACELREDSEDPSEADTEQLEPGETHPVLTKTAEQLGEYFAGEREGFELQLDLIGTDFQLDVWRALAAVPHGETRSYGEQAASIGRPGAFRAVGAANGKNPVPIVLPCHRIIASDGALTGFAGGLDRKEKLLAHERSQQSLGL